MIPLEQCHTDAMNDSIKCAIPDLRVRITQDPVLSEEGLNGAREYGSNPDTLIVVFAHNSLM